VSYVKAQCLECGFKFGLPENSSESWPKRSLEKVYFESKAIMGLVRASGGLRKSFLTNPEEVSESNHYVPQRESVDWNFPGFQVLDVSHDVQLMAELGLFQRPEKKEKELSMSL